MKVVSSILEALRYLHNLDIVHRDLKPANIMFKRTFEGVDDVDLEEVKLIDFGLCADLRDKTPSSLLNDKSGTVGYLAPELIMVEKGNFYNERVDIFSAGMILYEM